MAFKQSAIPLLVWRKSEKREIRLNVGVTMLGSGGADEVLLWSGLALIKTPHFARERTQQKSASARVWTVPDTFCVDISGGNFDFLRN